MILSFWPPFGLFFISFVSLENPRGSAMSVNMHILYYFSYIPTLATIWWSLITLMTLCYVDIDDFVFFTPFRPLFCLFCISWEPKRLSNECKYAYSVYFGYIPTLDIIWWSWSTLMTLYFVDVDDFVFLTPFRSLFCLFCISWEPKRLNNECKYAYSLPFQLYTNFRYHLVKLKHFNDILR